MKYFHYYRILFLFKLSFLSILTDKKDHQEVDTQLLENNGTKLKTSVEKNKSVVTNEQSSTAYITMLEKNLNKYKDTFHSDNKKLLIFDIDGTLYKYTKQFKEEENAMYVRAFETLKQEKTLLNLTIFKAKVILCVL